MHFNKLWWMGITLLFINTSFNLPAQQKKTESDHVLKSRAT
jgi:hypothetical protein